MQDVQRFREGPAEVEVRVKAQAQIDGPNVCQCALRSPQEPGSSGVIVIDHYARHVLPGRDFRGVRSSGNKAEWCCRPQALSAMRFHWHPLRSRKMMPLSICRGSERLRPRALGGSGPPG